MYPLLQSAYRKQHSTETALLKVMNDILLKMNSQHVTLLVMLDLSAALLILLITRFCLKDYSMTLAFPEYPCNGLNHTCLIEVKRSQFRECYLGFLISIVAFPKAPASVRCSTSSMNRSCSTSLPDIFLTRTAMLTILIYIYTLDQLMDCHLRLMPFKQWKDV